MTVLVPGRPSAVDVSRATVSRPTSGYPPAVASRGAPAGTAEGHDVELIGRAFALGDERALRSAWTLWAPSVVRLGRRLGLSREEADELVSTTFVAAWRAAGTFDAGRAALPAWLLGIARHRAVDALRARRPETPSGGTSDAAFADLLAGGRAGTPTRGEDPLEVVAGRALLAEALSWLPDAERQAMTLVLADGLSQRQVAAALGLPEGTARSRVATASRRLREWWEVSGGAPR